MIVGVEPDEHEQMRDTPKFDKYPIQQFSKILQKKKQTRIKKTVRLKSVSCRLSVCSKNRRRQQQRRPTVSVYVKECLCELYASNSNPFRNKDVLLYLSLVHNDNKNSFW